MIRCKFKCDNITEFGECYLYNLLPVRESQENREYWEATPSGSLSLTIRKKDEKLFNVGRNYMIDITEA